MNDHSFVAAFVFYFVMISLITYWIAYQTTRVITSLQKTRTSRQQAKVRIEVLEPQTSLFSEDQQVRHFSRQQS